MPKPTKKITRLDQLDDLTFKDLADKPEPKREKYRTGFYCYNEVYEEEEKCSIQCAACKFEDSPKGSF